MAASTNEIFNLLCTRPGEPIFMPKGEKKRYMFDVPDNFLIPRHRSIKKKLIHKWYKKGTVHVPIKNVNIPDITQVLTLPRNATFTLFLEKHQDIACELIKIFMDQKTKGDLISVAAYCHDRVNPYLFNYCLSVALLHRPDTKDVAVPSLAQTFPAKFVSSNLLIQAKQEATVIPKEEREPIVIPQMFTANLDEPEQRVAYFREDIGINLHHWHWHLVYPPRAPTQAMVAKDRRGELFYYMHHQMIARYNAERFCNDLPRVVPLSNLREVIPEAYFSKLVQGISSRSWIPRFANVSLKDLTRSDFRRPVKISDMETWEKNIKEAIKNRMAKDTNGNDVSLAGDNGIDILGDMLEASMLSINPRTYGNYHNMGHMLIGYCHDPEGKWLEDTAVMGDVATTMRDPVFFRWHNQINEIFLSLKDLSPCYTKDALTFNDVTVTDIKVLSDGSLENQFNTFWQQSTVDFSSGLDFTTLGPLPMRYTHLQHEPFTYTINVDNASSKQLIGYARIFMAPKYKEGGATMEFNEQRKFMIELDKFRVNLKTGANVVTRKSTDSSITIPFERTFRKLDLNRPPEDSPLMYSFNFCGCGWPQHMLIPKGTEKGAEYELFVMISDYSADKIDQDISGLCNDAESFCGIQDKKYPDSKSMGYPFDRVGEPDIKTLSDFLTPNMKVENVVIKFTNKIAGAAAESATRTISVVPAATGHKFA